MNLIQINGFRENNYKTSLFLLLQLTKFRFHKNKIFKQNLTYVIVSLPTWCERYKVFRTCVVNTLQKIAKIGQCPQHTQEFDFDPSGCYLYVLLTLEFELVTSVHPHLSEQIPHRRHLR